MNQTNMNEKIVQPADKNTVLVILSQGEKFVLENKYYKNEDESLIIRSTNITGKLFTPTSDGVCTV